VRPPQRIRAAGPAREKIAKATCERVDHGKAPITRPGRISAHRRRTRMAARRAATNPRRTPRRAGSGDAATARRRKYDRHGTSAGRPHSSPLTKLAIRPRKKKKMPILPRTAHVTSPSDSIGMRAPGQTSPTASTQPRHRRGTTSPPFQTGQHLKGWRGTAAGCRTAIPIRPPRMMPSVTHSTKSSRILRRDRRRPAPKPFRPHDRLGVEPSDQDAAM